mmetsp:Transcript_48032/g.115261  ORF Transcript_48032/g.115261 Transcript_48032/m.115261 type:complete len:211 (+) Transcript_48032:58-690(+)
MASSLALRAPRATTPTRRRPRRACRAECPSSTPWRSRRLASRALQGRSTTGRGRALAPTAPWPRRGPPRGPRASQTAQTFATRGRTGCSARRRACPVWRGSTPPPTHPRRARPAPWAPTRAARGRRCAWRARRATAQTPRGPPTSRSASPSASRAPLVRGGWHRASPAIGGTTRGWSGLTRVPRAQGTRTRRTRRLSSACRVRLAPGTRV